MHGIMQAAYSNGWAPLCIGSHYAVENRSSSPGWWAWLELAEDHSTTLMMNAHGWRGGACISMQLLTETSLFATSSLRSFSGRVVW